MYHITPYHVSAYFVQCIKCNNSCGLSNTGFLQSISRRCSYIPLKTALDNFLSSNPNLTHFLNFDQVLLLISTDFKLIHIKTCETTNITTITFLNAPRPRRNLSKCVLMVLSELLPLFFIAVYLLIRHYHRHHLVICFTYNL